MRGCKSEQVMRIEDVSAVILAGGKSSRMGTDKASLMFEGRTFLECQIDKLKGIGIADIVVSGYGEGMIPDEIPNQGPLGGIMTALKRIGNDAAVVVPVDVVLIEPDTIRTLIENHGDKPVTIAVNGEKKEFLIGVYDKSVVAEIEALLESDTRAVRALLEKTGCTEVEFSEKVVEFTNFNTPEEYQKLTER